MRTEKQALKCPTEMYSMNTHNNQRRKKLNPRDQEQKKSPLQSLSLYSDRATTKDETPKKSNDGISEDEFFSAFADPTMDIIKGKIKKYFAEERESPPIDELKFNGEVKTEVTGFFESWQSLNLTTDPSTINKTENGAEGRLKIIMNHDDLPLALRIKCGALQLDLKNEIQELLELKLPEGSYRFDLAGKESELQELGYQVKFISDKKEESSEKSPHIRVQKMGTFLKYNLLVRGSLGDCPLDELFEKDFKIKDQYVVFNMLAPVVYDKFRFEHLFERENLSHDLGDPGICLMM
jgi:hypothetical protein